LESSPWWAALAGHEREAPSALRRRLLSQRELAEKAGLSPTTILKLEDDRVKEPHPRTIRKLAQALDVDPAELVE